jgi:ribosomal protein S18 acetylase RimI-like enzyme
MIRFERATPDDAPALTAVQKRTFDDDSRRFAGQPSGGPPGYDSVRWQINMMIKATAYYKILVDEQNIGGMIVFDMGGGHFELGRIWIDPAFQDQGNGAAAMQFVEQAHPQAQRWTLDTPAWATRNHHFYEKMGYAKAREGNGFYFYEKRLSPP